MAAVIYYVRRKPDNPEVLEVAKSIQVKGARKPRFESDIWLHEGSRGFRAYYQDRTNKLKVEEVFEGVKEVVGDTYDIKELLKYLGYKWHPQKRVWVAEITEEERKEINRENALIKLAKEFVLQAGDYFENEYNNHHIKYNSEYKSLINYNRVGVLEIDGERLEFDTEDRESMIKFGQMIEKLRV